MNKLTNSFFKEHKIIGQVRQNIIFVKTRTFVIFQLKNFKPCMKNNSILKSWNRQHDYFKACPIPGHHNIAGLNVYLCIGSDGEI